MESATLPSIGWREWVHLPDLDIGPIKAKIDTGAKTSALHAYDVEIENGRVRFKVHTIQGRDDFFVQAEADLVEQRVVRDSGANASLRPVISTTLILMGQSQPVEVTLIDRQDMSFRMLVGRSAIANRFVVDCGLSNAGGIPESVHQWEAA